jgi:hypothetical protein
MKQTALIFTALLVLATTSLSASNETENRKVAAFTSIKVSSGIDLYLKMGDTEKVTVVADDDQIDDLVTEVSGGVLKIYMKDRFLNFNWGINKERKVYVTVKTLEALSASAGSDVYSESVITSENLKLDISSGSDLKIEVDASELWLEASSGSDAKLRGKAKNFRANASSGSDLNAEELKTKICKVEVSSGSDAKVYVTDEFYANASSGGDIQYSGEPTHKDIHESSGGDVSKR